MSLLDWGARALPHCADNIVAETYGADLAIGLYDKYRLLCQQQDLVPLPLDRIQGDIKPLLQHLDFRGRFRRRDLVSLIHRFHAKRSRIAPQAITEYRPRKRMPLRTILLDKQAPFCLIRVQTFSNLNHQLISRLIHAMIFSCKQMLSSWALTRVAKRF